LTLRATALSRTVSWPRRYWIGGVSIRAFSQLASAKPAEIVGTVRGGALGEEMTAHLGYEPLA